MQIDKLSVGFFLENTYILHEENEAIIIDPGDEDDRIIDFLESKKLNLQSILLTHGHLDHIGAVDSLYQKYQADIYLHEDDYILYQNVKRQASLLGLAEVNVPDFKPYNNDFKNFSFRGHDINIIHTPGHTMGSVCYLFSNLKWLFTGDTLFRGAIGRTDLPGGDPSKIIPSIKNNLLSLDNSIEIFPGHMETSTIGTERNHNPYLI